MVMLSLLYLYGDRNHMRMWHSWVVRVVVMVMVGDYDHKNLRKIRKLGKIARRSVAAAPLTDLGFLALARALGNQ